MLIPISYCPDCEMYHEQGECEEVKQRWLRHIWRMGKNGELAPEDAALTWTPEDWAAYEETGRGMSTAEAAERREEVAE